MSFTHERSIDNFPQVNMRVWSFNLLSFTILPYSAVFKKLEWLREYESDENSSSPKNDEFWPCQTRQVYTLTYSQADKAKFPSRKFGTHCHVSQTSSYSAMDTDKNIPAWQLWHFCALYTAWKCVTKEDKGYQEIKDHPDLTNNGEPRKTKAHETLEILPVKSVQSDS